MNTDGVKLSDLPELPLPVGAGDLIEVIRPRPDRPGQYATHHAPAAGKQIAHSDEETVGLARLATVEQVLAGERTDRAATAAGVEAAVAAALAERIDGADGITAAYSGGVVTISAGEPVPELPGINMQAREETTNRNFRAICWAPDLELFCTAGDNPSSANNIGLSADGETWALYPNGLDYAGGVCRSVALGLFCVVTYVGATQRASISADGMTWAPQTTPAGDWTAVCAAEDLEEFCAVAVSGTYQVMTSPDGETWTAQTSGVEANAWQDVCRSVPLGLYCAVSSNGSSRVMVSADGVDWQAVQVPLQNWRSVAWSDALGLFCAVSADSTFRVMTSYDGYDWFLQNAPFAQSWRSVTWCSGAGCWIALAPGGALGNGAGCFMASLDGQTWVNSDLPGYGAWYDNAWSESLRRFVAVNLDYNSSGKDFILGEIP